jgi:hypothetical protein
VQSLGRLRPVQGMKVTGFGFGTQGVPAILIPAGGLWHGATGRSTQLSNFMVTPASGREDCFMRGAIVADHHLDIEKAVKCFLQNYEGLSRLPLIRDSEMSRLFGEEVASALSELEVFNREGQVCLNCRGSCCRLVSCELYTPALACCPVQKFRPVLCRMHFCREFARVYPCLVKETGDIYLESLIAAQKTGYKKVFLFDCPPLRRAAPEMVESLSRSLVDFREGRRNEAATLRIIEARLEDHLNP